jgi:hypothetical protein
METLVDDFSNADTTKWDFSSKDVAKGLPKLGVNPPWEMLEAWQRDMVERVADGRPPVDPPFDAKKFLERVTYKEGVTFELAYEFNMAKLMIQAKYLDSRHRVTPVTIMHQTIVPRHFMHDEKLFSAYVRRCVHDLEAHEADEWLRVGGELLNDPHAPDGFIGRLDGSPL